MKGHTETDRLRERGEGLLGGERGGGKDIRHTIKYLLLLLFSIMSSRMHHDSLHPCMAACNDNTFWWQPCVLTGVCVLRSVPCVLTQLQAELASSLTQKLDHTKFGTDQRSRGHNMVVWSKCVNYSHPYNVCTVVVYAAFHV